MSGAWWEGRIGRGPGYGLPGPRYELDPSKQSPWLKTGYWTDTERVVRYKFLDRKLMWHYTTKPVCRWVWPTR